MRNFLKVVLLVLIFAARTGTAQMPAGTIASGTATLGTAAIASGSCASPVTVAAAGVLATDVLHASFNSLPTGVTGYVPSTAGGLYILQFPASGNVNFIACNDTQASISPGALTLNWEVVRGVDTFTSGLTVPSLTTTGSGTPTVQLGASGPTWTAGAGAPSSACVAGSMYSRTDGGAGTTLYVCEGPTGAWAPK